MPKSQPSSRVALTHEERYEVVERKALFGLVRWQERVRLTSFGNCLEVVLAEGTEVNEVRIVKGEKAIAYRVPEDFNGV